MIETDIESSVNSSLSSAMDRELLNDNFSKIRNVDPNILDWRFLSVLNGRDDFIVVNDTKGSKCWSLQSYYKVMSTEKHVILDGKGLMGIVGANTLQLTDLSGLTVFYINFRTVGCIPVLKRIEIKNKQRKSIGIIAENSKILSFASFRICNEQEGIIFNVKSKISFWKGSIYDIQETSRDGNLNKVIATVERKGPAYFLRVTKDVENVVSSSNKALFISLCIFLISDKTNYRQLLRIYSSLEVMDFPPLGF